MVYTCFQMVRDCRADQPEGWRYFVSQYVPVVRRLLHHYAGDDGRLNPVLLDLRRPQSSLFQSLDPSPERYFVAELRQRVLAALPLPSPSIPLDLETVTAALAPLTVVEKQAAWFSTMRYDAAVSGAMMRVAPATVQKIRDRAGELLRQQASSWNQTLLQDNGLGLGREAAALPATPDCPPAKAFLDILDGRTTWRDREILEEHVNSCWRCVDHYARKVEVIGILRHNKPLTDAEAAPFHQLLGVTPPPKSLWKRLVK